MNMGDGRVWRVVLPVGEVSDERIARSDGREGVEQHRKRERDVPGRARRSVSRPVGEGQGKQGKEARTRQAAGVGIPARSFSANLFIRSRRSTARVSHKALSDGKTTAAIFISIDPGFRKYT
jgi:hypothetical protein